MSIRQSIAYSLCFAALTAGSFSSPAQAYGFAPSAATNAGGPLIKSATAIQANDTQTITITGKNFGEQSAYSGNSPYIWIVDVTRDWAAGYVGGGEDDLVGVNVTSWTDKNIVIQGFTGDYGGNGGQYVFDAGDVVTIFVGNPSTGIAARIGDYSVDAAPSLCLAVVGSGKKCAGPR